MQTLEVLKRYLSENDLRPKSVEMYSFWMQKLADFSPEFPESAGQVLEFIHSLDGKYQPQTRRNALTVIRTMAGHMYRVYDVVNPCAKLKRGIVKVPKVPRRRFSAEEFMTILQSCRTPSERLLIMLMLETGARVSEIYNIRLRDFGDNYVDTSIAGKTGSHRYSCSAELVNVVRNLIDGPDAFVLGGIMHDGSGVPTLPAVKQRSRYIVTVLAGMKGKQLGTHTFRRSAGSMVAHSTRNVLEVMSKLQHEEISTSMIYIRDAEKEEISGVSPLKLVADAVTHGSGRSVEQMSMPEHASDVVVIAPDGTEQRIADELTMFSIPAGCDSIRPKLKRSDLEVLSMACVALTESERYGKASSDCKTLWNRMFRLAR